MAQKNEKLTIDPDRKWVFETEDELYDFFEQDIEKVEKTYGSLLKKALKDSKSPLEFTLEDPDEIWLKQNFFADQREVYVYLKDLGKKVHLAFCHCYEKEPVFIYSHFSVKKGEDLSAVREGQLVKDSHNKEVFKGALEGDSLVDGEHLAVGLYKAMLTLRSSDDFPEEDFSEFLEVREPSIEEADEIWRTMDSYGNQLVYFIKEFDIEESDESFFYIVATIEDTVSESNVLLFSFPTKDTNLVDRYRVGENMQAEEVVQEGSH